MLDTNIVSEILRRPEGAAARQARAVPNDVCVSIVVAAELHFGCSKKQSPRLTQRVEAFLATIPVLPLERPADEIYGKLRADLEVTGRLIGNNDLFIAAHALALNAILISANTAEFSRIPNLSLKNWL